MALLIKNWVKRWWKLNSSILSSSNWLLKIKEKFSKFLVSIWGNFLMVSDHKSLKFKTQRILIDQSLTSSKLKQNNLTQIPIYHASVAIHPWGACNQISRLKTKWEDLTKNKSEKVNFCRKLSKMIQAEAMEYLYQRHLVIQTNHSN